MALSLVCKNLSDTTQSPKVDYCTTYLMGGVAALDTSSVAGAAGEYGRGGSRKEGESEEGEGSSTGKHSECEGLGLKE